MYLKSIEIHGFKSFANKIVFEFHDGITAVVGPNGSGKSNVADAVRWVLGEQSAKQLRGSSMQDVIFSGSEARKPLGYAYVAITFNNADHALPIAYDEVCVARRVYRSGDSEYLINGSICRLRDVQELFVDTGIGTEGYSIIGQGQIERILSTKPEDRRELFDEAAGIVRFKKRKSVAQKNLEEEKLNLSRVNDILAEIDNQIGPLQKQSEVAREYLRLRDNLKRLEINQFLLDYERSGVQKKSIDEKYEIASSDYEQTKSSYESAKHEYDALEEELERFENELNSSRSQKNEAQLSTERFDGQIKVLKEQISSIEQSDAHFGERIASLDAEMKRRGSELADYEGKKLQSSEKAEEIDKKLEQSEAQFAEVHGRLEEQNRISEEINSRIIGIVGENGAIRTDLQRFETMLEQSNITKTEINQRVLINRSELDEVNVKQEHEKAQHEELLLAISQLRASAEKLRGQVEACTQQVEGFAKEYEAQQRSFLMERSKLESMKNIAERYDGYGNSIKRVMEKKGQLPGIEGVVADIISVDKKYETAIETALGSSIQNIVVDSEDTAKKLIEYLKREKHGRATFLPLTSVGAKGSSDIGAIKRERGVIGDGASLVSADSKYLGIISYLLGRIIVVDNIDNAIALEKKHNYSLRIVTLEGEQLNPGGSLSGGAYKNSNNLLGRRREIEELEGACEKLSAELAKIKEKSESCKKERYGFQTELDAQIDELQKRMVEENAVKVRLKNGEENASRLQMAYDAMQLELTQQEEKGHQLIESIKAQEQKLKENDESNQNIEQKLADAAKLIVQIKAEEEECVNRSNSLRLELSGAKQELGYIADSILRVQNEIKTLESDKENVLASAGRSRDERRAKEEEIKEITVKRDECSKEIKQLEKEIEKLAAGKDTVSKEHKGFLEKWQELGNRVNALDKEMFRLQGQREKLSEQIDAQISYIWDEYELTVTTAGALRDESIKNLTSIKREIGELKNSIKALGDVNVNAIEDYKNIYERQQHYTVQRDDLIEAEQKIRCIIEELDEEMRKQFKERFELIREQFNVVFRELFGGGRATLELVEDEDVLEAGIIIIAQPPGKKLQNMMQLSGGEKSLTAISLLFAIQNLRPSPFCLLDEIEAALDDSNVKRFAGYLKKLTKNSQFIIITHRRGTMAAADILYGITMQEKGVSTLVSVNLIENELDE